MGHPEEFLDRLNDLIDQAKAAGADAADAIYVASHALSVSYRLGAVEHLELSESTDVGLRVFVGKRQAIVSSSDLTGAGLADLPGHGRLPWPARFPRTPSAVSPDPGLLAADTSDLDMYDATDVPAEALIEWTSRAEASALAVPGCDEFRGCPRRMGGHRGRPCRDQRHGRGLPPLPFRQQRLGTGRRGNRDGAGLRFQPAPFTRRTWPRPRSSANRPAKKRCDA